MIACTEVLDEDQLLDDLPDAPFDTVDCEACQGSGSLYYGPCTDCMGRGEWLCLATGIKMAHQKMMWFSEKGQPASSEADAKLADARDRIEHFTAKCMDFRDGDSLNDHLCEHARALSVLLKGYADAVDDRNNEVRA